MEKKIVAVFVILAIFSASVFAAPVSVAASLSEQAQIISSPSADIDALFADINAVALTEEETLAVEGDGPIAAAAGAIIGTIVGIAAVVTNSSPYNPPSQSRDNVASRVVHAAGVIITNATAGAVIGALLPTP